ncbi:MAG TPA: N-acetylmuramoyl-L-alanine amidase [Candidatus Eisenbacteria bacterium]|nr:N-acetylmuramoyl-L-alanine amidase [Candidatus Eisenbacteria bacterium]
MSRRGLLLGGALLSAVALLASLATDPASAQRGGIAPIRVDRHDPLGDERITPVVLENVRYVSTNDLARIFGATKYWRPEIQKLSLRFGNHTIRFTVGAPTIMVDEDARNLVAPVRLRQGVVFAPEEIVGLLFAWGFVPDATYDESARVVRYRVEPHTVRQAQLFARDRVTEVVATLSTSLPARILYATPSEVRVLFQGGTLDSARLFAGGVVADGWMREVVGGVECRLGLTEDARGYNVNVTGNRLKVSVTNDQGLVDAGLFNALEPVELGAAGGRIRTVVIDPGHGGADAGASLPGGQSEKDVALDVARALRSALQNRLGVRVILTRESDADVPAERRAAIANGAKADLFVSVHLDNEGAVRGGGFRVLTQQPVASTGESTVAPIVVGDGNVSVELKPWRGAQAPVAGASMALGATIAAALREVFPATPTRTGTGRMEVLQSVACPAVLLESAPTARTGPEASSPRGYTIYDYTQTVARAIEDFVRRGRAS